MISTKLKEYLDNAGVTYTGHRHRPAYTTQEVAHTMHVPGREMVKSVILKADNQQLIMAVLSANDVANLDILREQLGCGVLRLASEMEFGDAFPTCRPGAMPPFGNIFNVPTYCDTTLSRNREIEFNAGTHEESIRIRFDDYRRLVNPNMSHFAQPYGKGLQRLAVVEGKTGIRVDITGQERALLLELIETAEQTAIESMAHADSRSFKNVLRKRLELLTSAKEKILNVGARAA